MKKSEAIDLLVSEGWTKADANRAVEIVDFTLNPNELTIRRAISLFAGTELIQRQRLQAAQKSLVTKKNKELEQKEKEYADKIEQIKKVQNPDRENYKAEIQALSSKNKSLEATIQSLTLANDRLKKDNRDLKNIIDEIKLKLTINMKNLLHYKDSEIRQAIINLLKTTLG